MYKVNNIIYVFFFFIILHELKKKTIQFEKKGVFHFYKFTVLFILFKNLKMCNNIQDKKKLYYFI